LFVEMMMVQWTVTIGAEHPAGQSWPGVSSYDVLGSVHWRCPPAR